ncbi:MAG: hypothetical protein KIS73_03735 [Enhydrobacter sp.]|nr:hypothetical protein [Enhydrobacter sp.]
MSTLKGAVLAFALLGSCSARADSAAGKACAGQLTSDGKSIYAATMAAVPTKDTIVDTVERETRSLVEARKIAWDVARDNAVAAAICVRKALGLLG